MTKLEAWQKWNESVGIGMDGTEYSLEKSSHGKAFSYAWDAAVKAEREACAKVCEETLTHHYIKKMADKDHPMLLAACADCAAAIRARGEV